MKTYITTPIYYASGAPHLGHCYTTLLADCYKSYCELCDDEAILITGTDEHGQKIERLAKQHNVTTQVFVDDNSAEFYSLWGLLGIQFEVFKRTTDQAHIKQVLDFWQRLKEQDDLYLGEYAGRYCVDCEAYFSTGDYCDIHKKPLELVSECCWFFRLSRYQPRLIAHIESHPDFILPLSRRNEVLWFLNNNQLHDLAVSRSNTRWGIEVPGDKKSTLYVWVDALVTYLSALGQAQGDVTGDAFLTFWRNTTHFIGKDILNFHGVYWPALLLSACLPLPKHLVVNGWLTVEGQKISKSRPETVIAPDRLIQQYDRDGLRYFFLSNVTLGTDVDFSQAQVCTKVNADLANNLGNLVSRVVRLIVKDHQGIVHGEYVDGLTYGFTDDITQTVSRYQRAFSEFNFPKAAQVFIELTASENSRIQNAAPWVIRHDIEGDLARRAQVLWRACDTLRLVCILGEPFIPDICARIRVALGLPPQKLAQIETYQRSFEVVESGPVFKRKQALELT